MLQCHHLIVQSNDSLGSSREIAQGCRVSFVNYLYLVPLIIGQNFCAICAKPNQTGPQSNVQQSCTTVDEHETVRRERAAE